MLSKYIIGLLSGILLFVTIDTSSLSSPFVRFSIEIQNKTTVQEQQGKHQGRRRLSLHDRITAEGRYNKLIQSFLASGEDESIFLNQLSYMENGYYDYDYLPSHQHEIYGLMPHGFWVYVYPKWYIWEEERLDFDSGP